MLDGTLFFVKSARYGKPEEDASSVFFLSSFPHIAHPGQSEVSRRHSLMFSLPCITGILHCTPFRSG